MDLPVGGDIEWVTLASAADDPYTAALDVIATQTVPAAALSRSDLSEC